MMKIRQKESLKFRGHFMKREHKESIRIFQNPLLEACTHVHPIIPLVMWSPVVLWFMWRAHVNYGHAGKEFLGFFIFGVFIWTLTEYTLHRFVFHFNAQSKLGKRFVFLFHGLHHDDPNDPTRLVMPPVPAILIVGLIYLLFKSIFPAQFLDGIMAFFLVGYLCYDYIHYATHHFPMTSKIGKYLRKYHLQHHFSHEESKYGVSSPLWDYVFGTVEGPRSE